MCNQCVECGLECELGPSKSTSCMECHKVKVKCEQPSKEKPERKRKRALAEEPQAGPSSLKRLKKLLEERSNGMVELVELEVDKVELM